MRCAAMRCNAITLIEHNQTAVHRTYHKRNPHAIPHHITINSIIVKELINQSHIKAKMRISTAEQMNPTRRNTMEDCHIYHQPNTPGLWEHPSTFIGVYDGHGGRDTVDFLQDALHLNIMEELNHGNVSNGNGIRTDTNTDKNDRTCTQDEDKDDVPMDTMDEAGVHERLERAFLITDVQSQMEGIQTSGATVAICLVEREMVVQSQSDAIAITGSTRTSTSTSHADSEDSTMRVRIHAANVGDARAVLSCTPDSFTCTPATPTTIPMDANTNTNNTSSSSASTTQTVENPQSPRPENQTQTPSSTSKSKSFRLTNDHKASCTSEISRIENAGGFLLRNRVLGIMAVARSLGDHGMKEFVIGRPFCQTVEVELKGYRMNQGNEFVILACDGLWDTVEDEEAIQMVRDYVFGSSGGGDGNGDGNGMAVDVDRDLLRDGAAKMLCGETLKRGTTDNVTVLVAWL